MSKEAVIGNAEIFNTLSSDNEHFDTVIRYAGGNAAAVDMQNAINSSAGLRDIQTLFKGI